MSEQIELTNDELATVLAETREFIVENGWGRGDFKVLNEEYDDEMDDVIVHGVVGYCAVGGVLYSQGIDEDHCCENAKVLAVSEALCKVIGIADDQRHIEACTGINCRCTVNWITTWNDYQACAEPVLDALMKAEKDARSGNVE